MFGEENKFALGVIDGSLEGGEGDMLREVERFLRATFFVGCEGEDSHCLGLHISLWGSIIDCLLGPWASLGGRK